MSMITAAALGTGAWGTMFARVLADAGVTVAIQGRNADTVSFINRGESPTYLPGIALSGRISVTADIAEVMNDRELVAVAVPVKTVCAALSSVCGSLSPDVTLLSLVEGPEPGSFKRVDETTAEVSGMPSSHTAVLSGPNLSCEIAGRQPTATVVATHDVEFTKEIVKARHNSYFCPYVSTDVVGTEMAGATKNVIVVAIGAARSMGLGINTRSTLATRSLAEMMRLGTALGADPATFVGLSDIGDPMVACFSRLSCNFSLGHRMGTGMGLVEAPILSPGVVEGITSASPVLQVMASVGVSMPITGAVVEIVEGRAGTEDTGCVLLARPQKMDGWKIELVQAPHTQA